MIINYYPLIRGIASYVLPKSIFKRPGSGGSYSSEYCYSVWLRHLDFLILNKFFPDVQSIQKIGEIGPGDSLGIGISAMFTGAKEYNAFDVIEHTNIEVNKKMNKEILDYYLSKRSIPNTNRQRNTHPILENYDFPSHLENIDNKFFEDKFFEIQKALEKQSETHSIEYFVPWLEKFEDKINNLDLIFSQAVMEHVDELEKAYTKMYNMLRTGGVISHQIDFKTHEMTNEWNGHWFIGENLWSILSHGRKYPMNRLPLSTHIDIMEKVGFQIKMIVPVKNENKFLGKKTKVYNIIFTKEDLETSSALVIAVK